jgi:hypothetical protein
MAATGHRVLSAFLFVASADCDNFFPERPLDCQAPLKRATGKCGEPDRDLSKSSAKAQSGIRGAVRQEEGFGQKG